MKCCQTFAVKIAVGTVVAVLAVATSIGVAKTFPATTRAATQAADDVEHPATVVVARGSLHVRIDAEGTLEPVDAVELRFKPKAYSGELSITYAAAPGAVKAGDKLLTIDERGIRKDLTAAKVEVDNETAALTKAQSDADLGAAADANALHISQDDLKNTTDALAWFDSVEGAQMLQQAELMAKQAAFAVEDQTDELDQLRKMYKTEDLTTATADIVIKRALRQLDLSQITAANAKNEAKKITEFTQPAARRRLAFAVDNSTNALAQLKATQALSAITRASAVTTAQLSLAEAQQKLTDLQADQKQFTQTASRDGVLYLGQFTARAWVNNDVRQFAVGEKLTASSVLMTLVSPGQMRATIDLPEAKFSSAKAGLAAAVVADANGKLYAGKSLAPSPLPRPGGFEWIVQLPAVDAALVPGMKAKVAIDAGAIDGLLLVPTAAVSNNQVWVQGEDGKPLAKHVVTGRTSDDKTEIVDGVTEGETILAEAQK